LGFARRFLLNFTFLTAGDLAAKALTFLAFAHIARVVGTELFGDVAFASAFTLYFALIVRQGFDVYGIQEVARNRSRVFALSSSILGLRLVLSVAAAAVLLATVPFIGKPPLVKGLLLLYGLSFFTSALSYQWVFQAAEEMKVVAASNVLAQLVFCVFALLVTNPTQLLLIPLLQLAGEVVSIAYLLALFRRHFGPVHVDFNRSYWPGILKESLPMGLSGALSMIMFNFDVILLGFLRPASEVGQYSAAYKVIALFSSFVLLYNRNLLPAVSRCRGDTAALRRISDGTQKYTLLVTVPLAVGGALLARILMQTAFGPQFAGAARAFRILIWIIPVSSSRVLYRATLLSHGQQNANLRISLAAVAVNVGLNCLLIPSFSYIGSAAASLVAEVLLLILMHRCVGQKVTRLPLAGHVWKPVLASIAMAAFIARCESVGIVTRVLGGFLVYVLAGMALRAFSFREIAETIEGR
jgi:O-antigen/teichoic acid export membrane protein